ncbi:tetraketide alpha-pyrone reductase 1-like isoform X3 [Asparagus officinalis]|uniref:tetraketide alpha-pyrone reductase 1-like isoform X3 n=1 Tax=Asparagus officinalis TaxID=4686 RepID=UPI00098E2DD7|nr:tetraketide alpha-pyrone reductase 1-like isoform X3 [Asparagus officinalis]XP_020275411.1 tetraketide alpha-pyrone reductase 1-like isoform X3 [Asparagus officinalis]XP_020275412.1 tetraketide alpha-pyrone reductase 1-like isoform X3 [Asparagus officinalis]XP_020275413.1 tetraketide alpha-pyrone reductase 1-like isoform X3 [Asparagus officinalis]
MIGHCRRENQGDYKKIGHLWELEGAKERLHLVRAELMDEGSFDDAIIGCEGVFHAAFPVLYPKSDPKAEVLDPAVEGTLNVLRSCKKSPLLKKVVLTSSTSAVARSSSDPKQPLDENSWSNAQECEKLKAWYPLGKLLAEQAAWRFAKENGINLVSVIPSFIIGPSLCNLHVTASDILSLLKGDNEKFARRGRMGYVHIDDVASCHILVYENDNTEGRYLCTSTVLEVPELASILAKRYPWLPIPTSFPSYVQGPRFEYDTSKVQKLGIKFKGIEEMFDDAIQSLKEQGHLP